ncbi:fimbrial protein [Burkholderia lata]|uniref:fimbrial protein n=1 Tax=Burkholderia lata (strain ATCC 17760 / DSM 23089 / LMG 22485 / NCIMB 9086 / R18194 / 383) TaxID=482957 RepID=UPI001452F422|nr:fimbrial protein [Burkholderia lata]VWD61771.1 fimbrial protein [Burkholderia lata]
MKQYPKHFVLAALLAAFGSTSALAADGTVNFHGKIVATTCKIDNSNIQVPLGAIGIDQLAEAGRESRHVPFQIALSECNDQLSGVRAQFEGMAHGDDPTLLAIGTGSKDDAKGVGIQLMHAGGEQIGVNSETDTLQLAPGSNVLNFAANYVSTSDQTEAGEANGTASFTLHYR